MDAAFREATLKGPLWEQVSRKLAELGYRRSAKKCKEKFENVHKYYKRTKEGRGGRQDGKSYKFFTQLEALNHNIATTSQVLPRIADPTSLSAAAAVSLPPPPAAQPASTSVVPAVVSLPPPPDHTTVAPLFGNIGVSFSSDSSSFSDGEDGNDDEEMESTVDRNIRRKRKWIHGRDDHSNERMMDFFEGLLKQVMQKQEAMQQKFLEAIEKREQDRMIREEAWKRQDMARIDREHDLMAQERAISTSRDATIIAFLEKITGQTIHLPTAVPHNPPPPTPTAPATAAPPPSEPQEQQNQPQCMEIILAHQGTSTSDVIAVVPEQHMPQQDLTRGSSIEMNSSRWPKTEVLALIQLRSGMESKYQEAGPKGPLWEAISAGIQRMGYNRSAKRCKEKWENINKYYKKVKESNKKRPEDAKTCPYFHELDALYRKKILGGSTSGDVAGNSGGLSEAERIHQHHQDVGMQSVQSLPGNVEGGRTQVQTSAGGGGAFPVATLGGHTQGNIGGGKQPEDMLKKQLGQSPGDMMDNCSNGIACSNSDDNNEEYDDDDVDKTAEEEMQMMYKIKLQKPNIRSSDGGGTPPSSFIAMVQ